MGQTRADNQERRRGVDCAERQTLARRRRVHGNGAHRLKPSSRQRRYLAGKSGFTANRQARRPNQRQPETCPLALIPLAYAVATGDTTQLDTAVDQGLAAGLTISELTEAISHQFAYIGAPKTLNGVAALQKRLEVRKAQGISDPQGKSATDLGNADYYALGTQTLAELSQAPTSRPIFDFAPALDYAIKAQLFGYQFSRDNLGAPERELVTLASLAAQGKAVNSQLRSHLRVLKNLGAGDEQLAQILAALEKAAGKAVAENVRTV